jgi:RNA polymerase sigma factor (sigma-70 family)
MINKDWEHIVNDSASYAKLYTDYYRKFYNYGKKFTTNTSLIEDSIQEVFLDIWVKRFRLLQITSINSYFFSAFRYVLLRKIKEDRKIVCSEVFETEPAFSADSLLINEELNSELRLRLSNAFQALTPHQREALFLRFYQDLSYEEVAHVLNITVKATYKIMARSLAALKDHMGTAVPWLLIIAYSKSLL